MECMSCKSDINPKWKFAIENNSCPSCGNKIMEEELKSLLSTLSSTVSSLLSSYPQQLDDWMLINFNYIKTNSTKLKDYLPKELRQPPVAHQPVSSNEEDSSLVAKVSDEHASKFFKNSGADKVVQRTEELKQLVSKIKSETPKQKIMTSDDLSEMMDESEPLENPYNANYNDDEIPASVLAFANQSNKKDPTYNAKDMLKLQQLQQRTLESRNTMINGTGGKGSFSRSS